MTFRSKLFHPATVIAIAALVVAAGGTGWAAKLVGTAQLKAGAVTSGKLARNSVTAVKIKAGAVGTTKLAPNAVRTAAIEDGAITRGKLAPLAIDTFALNFNAVHADQIADGSVATADLADGAVSTSKLADASVGGAKIANNAITADKIVDGQVVEGSGSLLAGRLELADAGSGTVVDVPGFGQITATCATGSAATTFRNTSGFSLNLQASGVENNVVQDVPFVSRSNPSTGGNVTVPNTGTGGIQTIAWQASYADATARVHASTVTVTSGAAPGNACVVSAQGITTG